MNKNQFHKIIDICSKQPEVRLAILKNYDDNLWWPLEIQDYRKRLIIAGLSTRISYNMINNYRKIINDFNNYSFEEIKNMSEENIIHIIKGLGLANTRYKYIKSMIEFIEKYNDNIFSMHNDELIEFIASNVQGASYKVAQCCVLYMRGYYCGIMPVDSGMKDVELPCIGFPKYCTPKGNNILRKELERLTKNNYMGDIINNNGYNNLKNIDVNNATWFVHLVLIYYKRFFCNKHSYELCTLRESFKLKVSCKK